MSANRITAFVDACPLVSVLRRNLLPSLAEAGLFRVRWSQGVLDETPKALESIHGKRGLHDAATARQERGPLWKMLSKTGWSISTTICFRWLAAQLPDPGDAHVLAAALKTGASTIVTENLKHFPSTIVSVVNVEAKSADVQWRRSGR